jgi:hypothetical protein
MTTLFSYRLDHIYTFAFCTPTAPPCTVFVQLGPVVCSVILLPRKVQDEKLPVTNQDPTAPPKPVAPLV